MFRDLGPVLKLSIAGSATICSEWWAWDAVSIASSYLGSVPFATNSIASEWADLFAHAGDICLIVRLSFHDRHRLSMPTGLDDGIEHSRVSCRCDATARPILLISRSQRQLPGCTAARQGTLRRRSCLAQRPRRWCGQCLHHLHLPPRAWRNLQSRRGGYRHVRERGECASDRLTSCRTCPYRLASRQALLIASLQLFDDLTAGSYGILRGAGLAVSLATSCDPFFC